MTTDDSAISLMIRAAEGDRAAQVAVTPVVLAGIQRWRRAQGKIPLERCLGIAGMRSFDRHDRDRNLRAAHALMLDSTPWKRAVQLADALAAFRSRVWPAWRTLGEPPKGCSEVYRHLDAAMRAAVRMRSDVDPAIPDTARQLHEIVKRLGGEVS